MTENLLINHRERELLGIVKFKKKFSSDSSLS